MAATAAAAAAGHPSDLPEAAATRLNTVFDALACIAAIQQGRIEHVPWSDVAQKPSLVWNEAAKIPTKIEFEYLYNIVQRPDFLGLKELPIKIAAFRALLQDAFAKKGHLFADTESQVHLAWKDITAEASRAANSQSDDERPPAAYISSADGLVQFGETVAGRVELMHAISRRRAQKKVSPSLALLLLARATVSLACVSAQDRDLFDGDMAPICTCLSIKHGCGGQCAAWWPLPEGAVRVALSYYIEWCGMAYFGAKPDGPLTAADDRAWWPDAAIMSWLHSMVSSAMWNASIAAETYARFNLPVGAALCYSIKRVAPAILGRELWDDNQKWFFENYNDALAAVHELVCSDENVMSRHPERYNWPHVLVLMAGLFLRQHKHDCQFVCTNPIDMARNWRVLYSHANGGLLVMAVNRKFYCTVAPTTPENTTKVPPTPSLLEFSSPFDVLRMWRKAVPAGF